MAGSCLVAERNSSVVEGRCCWSSGCHTTEYLSSQWSTDTRCSQHL